MSATLRNRRSDRIANRLDNLGWAGVILLGIVSPICFLLSYALSKVI